MKKFSESIRDRYLETIHIFFADGLMVILSVFLYRYRVHDLIWELHHEFSSLGFSYYLFLSFTYDGITIMIILLALMSGLFFLSSIRRLQYIYAVFITIIILFYFLFMTEFFRVYETTFTKDFAGKEHFTGFGNVMNSIAAEFSPDFFIFMPILVILILIMNYVVYRWDRMSGFSRFILDHPRNVFSRFFKLFPPALIGIFLIFFIASSFHDKDHSLPAGNTAMQKRRVASLLHEFTLNPLYNLFQSRSSYKYKRIAELQELDSKEFAFHFDTSSLVSDFRYGRISIIPRGIKYNIILYFFESTPYKYLNMRVDGKYVAETLQRLSQNAFNATRHYANYPLSANALLSILTSSYEMNEKQMAIQKYPHIKLQAISQILRNHGYRTCVIHTGGLNYAGQKRFLKNRSFDKIIDYDQLVHTPPYNRQIGWGVDERAMIKPSIDFIKEDPEKPFLLVLLPVNPHHPYAIPDESFRITGKIPEQTYYKKRNWLKYLNSLHYADASLGMLVDELDNKHLLTKTLLFVFSDHGEAFYQHRMNYNHPLYIYEENVHVPLMIYSKELFSQPVYHRGITRHIDILPTILDILSIPSQMEQEGISFLSAHKEQMALLHTSWKDDIMGIRDGQWKYIIRLRDQLEELYNLKEDPEESKNLASIREDILERYRKVVDRAILYKAEYYRRIAGK